MASEKKWFKRRVFFALTILLVVFFMTGIPIVTRTIAQSAETGSSGAASPHNEMVQAPKGSDYGKAIGLIAAGLAFGLGAVGAGIAIGNIGAAAMGAISEKPEIAANALIFIALAEGLMVFGFITAIIILGQL
jgi:V/A-type H+-transporting ATPase subunit K